MAEAGAAKPAGAKPVRRWRFFGWRRLSYWAFGTSSTVALVYAALLFCTWQEYRNLLPADISDAPLSVESGSGDDANGNGTQALYIDARALQIVFQGAAVNGGLMFFATLAFMLTSGFLLLCGCVSMAHPVRKLSRGICIGAAFWMAILTIITTLQLYSIERLGRSVASTLNLAFNNDIVLSCVAFGYISAATFLVMGVSFIFWRETVVRNVEIT